MTKTIRFGRSETPFESRKDTTEGTSHFVLLVQDVLMWVSLFHFFRERWRTFKYKFMHLKHCKYWQTAIVVFTGENSLYFFSRTKLFWALFYWYMVAIILFLDFFVLVCFTFSVVALRHSVSFDDDAPPPVVGAGSEDLFAITKSCCCMRAWFFVIASTALQMLSNFEIFDADPWPPPPPMGGNS